jgi:hypothetical protein
MPVRFVFVVSPILICHVHPPSLVSRIACWLPTVVPFMSSTKAMSSSRCSIVRPSADDGLTEVQGAIALRLVRWKPHDPTIMHSSVPVAVVCTSASGAVNGSVDVPDGWLLHVPLARIARVNLPAVAARDGAAVGQAATP